MKKFFLPFFLLAFFSIFFIKNVNASYTYLQDFESCDLNEAWQICDDNTYTYGEHDTDTIIKVESANKLAGYDRSVEGVGWSKYYIERNEFKSNFSFCFDLKMYNPYSIYMALYNSDLSSNVFTIDARLFTSSNDIYLYDKNLASGGIEPSGDALLSFLENDEFNKICIIVDYSTEDINYCVNDKQCVVRDFNDSYYPSSPIDPSRFYIALNNDSYEPFTGQPAYSGNSNYKFDNIEFKFHPESTVTWFYPQNGYEVSNDEWNNWGVYYNLSEEDLGLYNLLRINYCDSYNNCYIDYDFISLTTDLTYWTMERTENLDDGIITSYGDILKTDLENCNDVYEDSCVWHYVANLESIEWTASSTGYNIFDNPYSPTGFTPATTTSEISESEMGEVNKILNTVMRIFPLSLANQIYQEFNNVENKIQYEKINIDLKDIIHEDLKSELIEEEYTLVSDSILADNLPIWSTKIYPLFEVLIWLFGFFGSLIIIFPRFKNIFITN